MCNRLCGIMMNCLRHCDVFRVWEQGCMVGVGGACGYSILTFEKELVGCLEFSGRVKCYPWLGLKLGN